MTFGGPEGLGPPGLLNRLATLGGPQAQIQFQNLLDLGLSPGQAFSQLSQALASPGPSGPPHSHGPGFESGPPGRLDPGAVEQVFNSLPQDVQQVIVRGADQLPQPVRNALDQLGITQPQARAEGGPGATGQQQAASTAPGTAGPAEAAQRAGGADVVPAAVREAVLAARAEPLAAGAQPAAARAAGAEAAPLAANTAAVRDAPAALAQGTPAERATQQALPAGTRAETTGFAGVAREPGTVVAMPDRLGQLPQASQTPNAPGLARPESVPMQAMAAIAGATVLANPQAVPAPAAGHVGINAPAPPGTDAAAAQARDVQLAPAGHTLAGFLRRDRRNPQGLDRRPENWALAAMLADVRKRRARDGEEQMTSFQWLFWIVTIVAYGSIGFALIALIPGQPGLTTGTGKLNASGYALVLGALATVASWIIGRRIARATERDDS